MALRKKEERVQTPRHNPGAETRPPRPWVRRGKTLWGAVSPYAYILPIAVTLLVFAIIPAIMSVGLSFTSYNILKPPVFNGLYNYRKLLRDPILLDALRNTFLYALMVVPIQTALALVLGTLVVGKGERFPARFARAAFFIPFLTAASIIGIVWKALLTGDLVLVDRFFALFGLKANLLLGSSKTALATLAGIAVWKDLGYYMLFYVAGLMDIPQNYYEAARVDGAGPARTFFRITLPLIKPTTILVVFLGIANSFQVFDLVYSLTGGGPGTSTTTLPMYAYDLNFGSNNAGYAMAVCNILLVIVALVSIFQRKLLNRERSEL